MNSFERARLEGEELLKALGGSLEGGRRTRSSTRGPQTPTVAVSPPPAKKSRRGRKVKEDVQSEADEPSAENHAENNKKEKVFEIFEIIYEICHLKHFVFVSYILQESNDETDNLASDDVSEKATESSGSKLDIVEKMEVDEDVLDSKAVEVASTEAVPAKSIAESKPSSKEPATSSVSPDEPIVGSSDSNECAIVEAKNESSAPESTTNQKNECVLSSTTDERTEKAVAQEAKSVPDAPTPSHVEPDSTPNSEAKVDSGVKETQAVAVNLTENGTQKSIPEIKIDNVNENESKTEKSVSRKFDTNK